MTDKKRGRPTVKKKDEGRMFGCSLPTGRECIEFRKRNLDETRAFRKQYGDDRLIRDYEALSNPKLLARIYEDMIDTLIKAVFQAPDDISSMMTVLNAIPAAVATIHNKLILMGAAYFDILLEGVSE